MNSYTFNVTLTVDADSPEEAKRNAENWEQNISHTMEHSPFPCNIDVQLNNCTLTGVSCIDCYCDITYDPTRKSDKQRCDTCEEENGTDFA